MQHTIIFWQRWLFVVSAFVILFGLVMAIFNSTAVFQPFNDQINPVFWGEASLPAPAGAFQAWVYAVLGATVMGWGITLAFIAAYPFRRGRRWAWWAILTGLLSWYVVDTSFSLAHRVWFNAFFNTLLLVLTLVPLIATRRTFLKGNEGVDLTER